VSLGNIELNTVNAPKARKLGIIYKREVNSKSRVHREKTTEYT
jgi:hypothetical protein